LTRRSRRLLLALLAGAALLAAVRWFVAEPFLVPSTSMSPTLRPGERVLVNKLAYRVGAPQTGDLVVFRRSGPGAIMLKRVVAVGGETVSVEDGVLHVDGIARREPFADLRLVDSVYFGPVTVPGGTVFVLGDNRGDSQDSADFGAIPSSEILGRVELRIWPPSSVGRP
jgi:signal peptidase I